MDSSSLEFITCDELREEFTKCVEEINKRILILDVRDAVLYQKSHLCLDNRSDLNQTKRKMRVMNINPDLVNVFTLKNMMSLMSPDDLEVFKKRRDATDVIVIDSNTDNIVELADPKSKVMRLIRCLKIFDVQKDDKIKVPIKVLRGGYREWFIKYTHLTTNSSFDPDSEASDYKIISPATVPQTNHISSPISPQPSVISPKPIVTPSAPLPTYETPCSPQPSRPAIMKPVPKPPKPVPVAPKPNIIKNAPGTAVPVNPSPFRTMLPRSHSSPNVAQAEGDELSHVLNQDLKNVEIHRHDQIAPPKPRFDRTLKPAFTNESISAIRAQLNFGRSPEAWQGKAISGLQNLGNTCFMNSVVQCLAYAPGLVDYFCSDVYYNHINFNAQYGSKGELAIEFGALVEKLNSHRHRYIEPRSFRDSITKHIGFAGNEQQDSHEFMMMLFDKLHHDLNIHGKDKSKQNGIVPPREASDDDSSMSVPRATLGYQFWKRHLELNKSIISDLFEGIFMSTLTCNSCTGQSNTFEVFNCLSLQIPSRTRCQLRDCLSDFSNQEIIKDWECPKCKLKREANKKIVICKLPKILIVHLKRFYQEGEWRQKLQTTVDFPLTDLSVDCTNVLPQSAYGSVPPKCFYNLYATVNHYGRLDGGHYTAFCKLENHRWYKFDDNTVSDMRDADVCGQAAYLLFYVGNY